MSELSNKPLTVFYDGGCPLCAREILHYRRIAPNAPVRWIDVCAPTPDPELARWNLAPEAAMAEFHVLDADGHFARGADGFLLLWSVLPYYRWLSSVCRWLRVAPILRTLYSRFARWHYRKRCAEGFCRTN